MLYNQALKGYRDSSDNWRVTSVKQTKDKKKKTTKKEAKLLLKISAQNERK